MIEKDDSPEVMFMFELDGSRESVKFKLCEHLSSNEHRATPAVSSPSVAMRLGNGDSCC